MSFEPGNFKNPLKPAVMEMGGGKIEMQINPELMFHSDSKLCWLINRKQAFHHRFAAQRYFHFWLGEDALIFL